LSKILEEDIKAWDQETVKESKKKQPISSKNLEDATLGKRKSEVKGSSEGVNITMDDLLFVIRNTPRLNKTKLQMEVMTKMNTS